MTWGRRSKTGSRPNQSPSSPRPSLLSSWLLKFKKMGGNGAGDDESTVKDKPLKAVTPSRRRTQNSPSEEAEFYGGEDAYWRLSFRKGKMDHGYELEDGEVEADEEEEGEGEVKNFSEMVSGIRRRREMQRSTESLPELNLRRRVKEKELKTPRRPKMKGRNSRTSEIGEDPTFSPLGIGNLEGLSPELGSEERKSLYISRGSPKRRTKHTCRVRISSPRTASKAEISRLRAKKRANERKKGLERFAVVKCSFDPQSDFRDSMLEMILERRICQPDELEELLACYLTLNSDEYHDLIIKVFRQIWFELNQASYDLTDDAEGQSFY